MVTTATLKQRAKKKLAGNWWTAILVTLFLSAAGLVTAIVIDILQAPFLAAADGYLDEISAAILNGVTPADQLYFDYISAAMTSTLFDLIDLFASVYRWLFSLSAILFFLGLVEGQKAKFGDFTKSFNRVGESLWLYFLMSLKIFLWTLLFIIPGIVKTFSYMLAPMIKAKNPERTANECIAESCRLMNGNKASAFVLMLSFIGWYILLGLATYGAQSIPTIGTYFADVIALIAGAMLNVYVTATEIEFYREVVNPTKYFAGTPAPQQPEPFEELKKPDQKPSVFGDFYDAPAEQAEPREEKPTEQSGTQYAPQQQKDGKDRDDAE